MVPLRQEAVLIALVVTPVVLTILFGFIFELKISSNMMVGAFPLAPLLAMRLAPAPDHWRLYQRARILVITITVAVLLASPVIADVRFSSGNDPDAIEPRQEIAQFVTRLWHDRTRTPLRIVTGTDPYENAIGFYSPDRPAVLIDFSFGRAPWITPDALTRNGLLIVCVRDDVVCQRRAARLLPPPAENVSVTLSHSFHGRSRRPVTFDIFLLPPAS